jgi:drug/metabolite transporter (DMT)-like permease
MATVILEVSLMARSHLVAVLQALLVTFLWSTSWVLIKIGLADIPALTFAGLRYFMAFGLLLLMGFRTQSFKALRQLSRQSWGELALLGIVMYTLTQGMPSLGWQSWLIIIWLAVVNTAFAFTLWNLTLRSLSAVESSTINNTMLIQIAFLAWIVLGETLNMKELLGLALAALGVAAVQLVKVLPYSQR